MKPRPLKRTRCDGRAEAGLTVTPSAVLLAVVDTVLTGLPCSVSVTVNVLLPDSTNGAGTRFGRMSVPAVSVCRAVPPSTGAPSIVRSTFEFGVKPMALTWKPSLCGPCAVLAVT